jgi:hypothetical protein
LATILIKNVPEDLLKELKKLKIETGSRTWADLLAKLLESEKVVSLSQEDMNKMRAGAENFLGLRDIVSRRWTDPPIVLEEVRRTKRHETSETKSPADARL